ncbi:MAG TPA: hypothetical protein VHM23_31335, partial [Actinomycetota bacterium]|nr:hypothetical protein [Actinomycetota bacterium]
IVLALYVVADVLFTTDLALWTAIGAVIVFGGLWYLVPMLWRSPSPEEKAEEARQQREDSGEDEDEEQAQESRGASSRR